MMTSTTTSSYFRRIAVAIAAALVCIDTSAQGLTGTDVSSVINAVDDYRSSREATILKDFIALLSLPNVANNLDDMEHNVDHITDLLESRGFTTRRLSAGGAPYIYAELATPGAAETILIYAHFDGQPVLEEDWAYPPFSPTLLNAPVQAGGQIVDVDQVDENFDPEWRLYARSAGDDKMPVIALVHALDALAANDIDLSVNIKLLLDGEEERGSPTVGRLIDEFGGLMDADLLLFCDGPMHQSRQTQLVFGVRGTATVDITTYGATRPLHSGHYGNWAPNPIMQLAYLLTSIRDESGRILIDGYYDDVKPLSELERAAIASMPDMTQALQDELSVHTPEGGGMRLEELITLPAVNARGIVAGGVGAKGSNIILSTATVSLNLRFVSDQQPQRARELIEAHILQQGFHIVYEDPSAETLRNHAKVAKLEWRGSGYPALRTALDHPTSLRLTSLMRLITPDLIVTPTMGGSLPLHEFGSRLSTPIIVLPLANHDNNQHAENENIRLQNLWDAISIYGTILATFGAM
jgi:acetylornithine deacetylase/succinyl-diaminopimelate desuccinylase-like protein